MRSDLKPPANDPPALPDVQAIREDVTAVIASTPAKLTPSALQKILAHKYGFGKQQIKTLIKGLILSGEVTYTYEYGGTHLERSFNKPVRISTHVILKPPGLRCSAQAGDVVVQIKPGAAFGCGRHPTTRLALRGIEQVQTAYGAGGESNGGTVLDVGTGSGILVIAAILMGFERGLGIDTDPCARAEARENIKVNGLDGRIDIADRSLQSIRRRFCLVAANLRFPSLQRWRRDLAGRVSPGGFLVLSGVRIDERERLLNTYAAQNCRCLWQAHEMGWAGVVLRRQG